MEKLPRIALLVDGIWPDVIGGIQKFSFEWIKMCVQFRWKIDLYIPLLSKESGIFQYLPDDASEYINIIYIEKPSLKSFPGHYLFESYLFSKNIFKYINKNKISYEIIYSQGFTGWYSVLNKNELIDQPAIIVNFHGLEMFQISFSTKARIQYILFRFFVNKILKRADYVQSLGGKLTDILLNNDIKSSKILVHGNGISSDWFGKNKLKDSNLNLRKFIFIGRYERRKGIEELTNVLKELNDLNNFEFHFIGPIPESLKLNLPYVNYHGLVKDKDAIRDLLYSADILVSPSFSEGMPTVILEAMACECAIIATNVGAVSLLVSEENGILLKTHDEQELKNAILELNNLSQIELNKLKQNSVVKSKEYSWENVFNGMVIDFKRIAQLSQT